MPPFDAPAPGSGGLFFDSDLALRPRSPVLAAARRSLPTRERPLPAAYPAWCGQGKASATPRASPAPRVLSECAGPFVVPGREPSRSSTPPAGGAPATGCEGCHAAIAEEWQASFHRSAFVDETFQSSLAMEEPKDHAFCNGCHAPAAARAGVAVGVDCVSCHGGSPHEKREANRGSSSCKTCHEFTFDDGRPELVQKTVSEHAASDFASVPCSQCHMPGRDGHQDHRFLSGHAPERIARALQVRITRGSKESSVRITIHSSAGHAFPTGDMFRRARLVVFAEGARGQIVANAERTFGRTWGGVRGGEHAGARTQLSDTRILGSWQEDVELEAPSAPIAAFAGQSSTSACLRCEERT